jgi:MEMO1 family protein
MQTRKPIVAGQFYPGRNDECPEQITEILETLTTNMDLPSQIVAGIVPHAGWTFSGRTAAIVFWAVKQLYEKVHTFVIFGATHRYFGDTPAVYDRGFWETPLGQIAIDDELADAVLTAGPAERNLNAHNSEHSIEVQVPFIQQLFPGAKILPILTSPGTTAITLGMNIAGVISSQKQKRIICIGSTDLTHYGPRYGFTPMGIGTKALQWAQDINDRQFIDLAISLDPQGILDNAATNYNACGPGAAAAATACAKTSGVEKGILLAHTNSNQIMESQYGTSSDDSVGYAAIIF